MLKTRHIGCDGYMRPRACPSGHVSPKYEKSRATGRRKRVRTRHSALGTFHRIEVVPSSIRMVNRKSHPLGIAKDKRPQGLTAGRTFGPHRGNNKASFEKHEELRVPS